MPILQTYLGRWTNYSQNPTNGATITLSDRDADVLQGFLAIFISFVGSQFWTIISFVMYQVRVSSKDKFYRKRRVILRNSATPGDTAYDFVKLVFRSTEERKRRLVVTMALALFAVIIFTGFTAAGIFIPSKIKFESGESLILGQNCGFFNVSSLQTNPALNNLKQKQDTTAAANFARNCYGVDPKPPQCNRFAKPELTWTSTSNVPCPFDLKLCKVNASTGYSMDTGHLDSLDFGINAPSQDRFFFRKATTCAPLMAKQLAKMVNDTDEYGSNHTYVQLYFGPLNGITNYTYSYDLATGGAGSGYDLESYLAFGQYDENIWSPIPELNRTDADISLVILAQNSVVYIEPVDDPFFAAHVDFNGLYQGRNATYYFADTYFHILACAEQYQYCNPNSLDADGQPLCTDLSSSVVIERQTPTINLSAYAVLTTQLFNTLLPLANIFGSIGGSGVAALRASDIVFHQVSGPLPDNQWTKEVSAWFGTALSRLQHGIVEFATGPPDAYLSPHSIENGKTETWNRLCGSIIVGDADNQQSFIALAVWLILGVGCAIVVVSWLLEPLVVSFKVCFASDTTRLEQWEKEDKLSLLEAVFENKNEERSVTTPNVQSSHSGEVETNPAPIPQVETETRRSEAPNSKEGTNPALVHQVETQTRGGGTSNREAHQNQQRAPSMDEEPDSVAGRDQTESYPLLSREGQDHDTASDRTAQHSHDGGSA